MNTDEITAPETPAEPTKRKRGRPRKNPQPTAPAEQDLFAAPLPPAVDQPQVADAIEASVPAFEPPAVEAFEPPPVEEVATPPAPEFEQPSISQAEPASSAPEAGLSLDADMQSRREAAMRMKRGIDDMSDSIAAMQAFFSKKASTQTAMAQQARSLANKAAKQAAREQAAKTAAVKAAAARLVEAAKLPTVPSFPGKVRVDRWGRPIQQPQQSSSGAADAALAAKGKYKAPAPGAASAPLPPPPAPDMPVLNMLELQRCGAADLAALVDEAKLDDKSGTAFSSRHDLVLALLAEHARRGGAVEGEGIFVSIKEQTGCLVSTLNGLHRTPTDVRVGSQIVTAAGLRPGDHVVCRAVQSGNAGGRGGVMFEAADIVSVNGLSPEKARRKLPFDAFQPRVPTRRILFGGAPDSWLSGLGGTVLPEGGRALLVFAGKTGAAATSAAQALAEIASGIKAANSGVDVVLALADPDTATLAALGVRAAADRDAGLAPAFELIAQDPGDHQDRATVFVGILCDYLRRRVANGRRVVLVTDLPSPYSAGFVRSLPGTTALAPDSAVEREAAEFRRLWGSARDLDGSGSLTIIASARIFSKCDEALVAHLCAGADAYAEVEPASDGAPAVRSGAGFSRRAADSLTVSAPESVAPEAPVPVFHAPEGPF